MAKEKVSSTLFWMLFFIYIVNIVGKTSFSAATVALVSEEILTKTQAGIVSGCFWLLYAVGQFFGGFATNKVNSYALIQSTIISSLLANLLMVFEKNFLSMLITWGLNGALQFGLWPALLKIVSTEIQPKQRPGAMAKLGFCYCLGSVVSYVLTSVILLQSSYRYIFMCCSVTIALSLVACIYAKRSLSPRLQVEEQQQKNPDSPTKGTFSPCVIWNSGVIAFCLLIAIRNIVDSGIKSWMPVIIMETYGATASFSTLLSVGLLITNIFGVIICVYIYSKTKYDELRALQIMYLMVLPMILFLLGFENMNMYVTTVLMSVITLLVYGSGQIMMINYPNRFQQYGLIAAVGGIINSFAAFGNVIASYAGGYVAEHYGWKSMIWIWNLLIIIFVIVSILLIPIWKKFRWGKERTY